LDRKVRAPEDFLIATINERGFPVRIEALNYLESVSRQWEWSDTPLRKKRVAYILIVEMGIQAFDKLVGNL
jgi:hypothetical protein